MIHCDTTDQYFLCRWILVNFEESAVRLELIAANQVRVYNDPYTLKKEA